MRDATPLSRSETIDYLESNPAAMVRIGVVDVDGIMRGKWISGRKFLAACDGGLSICDCLLGWDVADELYEKTTDDSQVGWRFGFPDAPLRVIENAVRLIADADGCETIWALCEFDGSYETLCPRSLLRRVVSRLEEVGFGAKCGFEYEFTLFREDGLSLYRKEFRNLDTLSHGNFGYSILKTNEYAALFRDLSDTCRRYGVPLEGLHTENGPGIWEAALAPSDPLHAADSAALFKLAAKEAAARRGMTACFMAKWSAEHQGQGGHIHLSLLDTQQQPCFSGETDAEKMNPHLRHFLGGQQQLVPALLAMTAPTVNSYKRLVPGTWAPTAATWGIDNRTCALRVVGNSPSSLRVEYRVGGADANPYLAAGAALGSGLYGLENSIEPSAPTDGNAYDSDEADAHALPRDLAAAAALLRQSEAAKSLFGEAFVLHFAMTREAEHERSAQHVTTWEKARYLEII